MLEGWKGQLTTRTTMATIKLCQINARRSSKLTPEIRTKFFEQGKNNTDAGTTSSE